MAIHPWTMYEVARYRDEERLLRAQAAMRALHARDERARAVEAADPEPTISWVDRIRQVMSMKAHAPAGAVSTRRHGRGSAPHGLAHR